VPHISQKFGQFRYFDTQLGGPDWKDKQVLDFGGNVGNFLKESPMRADHYWCVDVSAEAIETGKREMPAAHWIWYDRYNISFNPNGSKDIRLPELGPQFDIVLAYSVFTHTDVDEMKQLAASLLAMLKPEGRLAFTFIDPHYRSWEDTYPGTNLEWRLERNGLPRGQADFLKVTGKVKGARWFRLAGEADVYLEDEPIPNPERYAGRQYHVFHAPEFMLEQFPGALISEPVHDEMQHCCLLRKETI